MKKLRFAILSLMFIGLFNDADAEFLCVDWNISNSSVYLLNEINGDISYVGKSGFSDLNSLARDSHGDFYSVSKNTLVRIDPSTGVGTQVATLDLPIGRVRSLAFSSDDELYAIDKSSRSDSPSILCKINILSSTVTVLGQMSPAGIQALEFSENDTLYGWDMGLSSANDDGMGLVTINTDEITMSDVSGEIEALSMQSLGFSSNGTLYGASTNFYKIDIDSGAYSKIFYGYPDIRGIAYIPEPATLLLITLGGLALRKRK